MRDDELRRARSNAGIGPAGEFCDDGRSQKERMLAGEAYRVDAELLEELGRAHVLAVKYAALFVSDKRAAHNILKQLLGYVGDEVVIRPPLYVDYGRYIRVGARSFINYGLVALDVGPIIIGEDVRIGPNVQLLTPTHPLNPADRRSGWEGASGITLQDNVWIGGGAIVLPGVSIGRDSVVGAGAVVSKDVPPGVLVVGNPARIVRRL